MNADGTSVMQLTDNEVIDFAPLMSSDGTKILYESRADWISNGEIYLMSTNSTGHTNLTNHPARDRLARWSPDGSRIAFLSERTSTINELFVMNADGSKLQQLLDNIIGEGPPAWSHDSSMIAFYLYPDFFVINADGTGLRNLTNSPEEEETIFPPSWKP